MVGFYEEVGKGSPAEKGIHCLQHISLSGEEAEDFAITL